MLRSALAQGHSDEALAGILRKVLAGASPQTALTEPAEPEIEERVAEPEAPAFIAPEPVYTPRVTMSLAMALAGAGIPARPPAVEEIAPPVVDEVTVETPAVEAPVVEAPVVEAPVFGHPSSWRRSSEAPAVEAPAFEAPARSRHRHSRRPSSTSPPSRRPLFEPPLVEAPVYAAPVDETPVVEASLFQVPDRRAGRRRSPAAPSVAIPAPASSIWGTPADSIWGGPAAHEHPVGRAGRLAGGAGDARGRPDLGRESSGMSRVTAVETATEIAPDLDVEPRSTPPWQSRRRPPRPRSSTRWPR